MSVSGQCSGCGQPCLHHLHVLVTAFPGDHSLRLAFGSFYYPHPSPPSPLFFPLINHCDWCLVPLAWGLMARRRRFTSYELALPKVEAPGYPGHPRPLSDALYTCDPNHDH